MGADPFADEVHLSGFVLHTKLKRPGGTHLPYLMQSVIGNLYAYLGYVAFHNCGPRYRGRGCQFQREPF